jgi:hypothetical protein
MSLISSAAVSWPLTLIRDHRLDEKVSSDAVIMPSEFVSMAAKISFAIVVARPLLLGGSDGGWVRLVVLVVFELMAILLFRKPLFVVESARDIK